MKTRTDVQGTGRTPLKQRFNLDGALAALIATHGQLLDEASHLGAEERALAKARREEGGPGAERADSATNPTSQEVAEALERQTRGELLEVEAALDRIDNGSYGVCDRCGQPVDPARLRALPWARYCLNCQQYAERRAS